MAESGHVPLTNRLVIDENRLLDLLEELRNAIPPAVQEAQRIAKERDRVLGQAREAADEMVREARAYAEQLTKESNIAQRASDDAARIEAEARVLAREIRESARQYADDVLARVEANLQKAVQIMRDGRSQLAAMTSGEDEAAANGGRPAGKGGPKPGPKAGAGRPVPGSSADPRASK